MDKRFVYYEDTESFPAGTATPAGVRRWRCACSKPCARFRCDGCGTAFSAYPTESDCPRCPSAYVKWENFEAWRRSHSGGKLPHA